MGTCQACKEWSVVWVYEVVKVVNVDQWGPTLEWEKVVVWLGERNAIDFSAGDDPGHDSI